MGFGAACIALVTQPTRLQGLLSRWSTKSAAKFRLGQNQLHERQQRLVSSLVANVDFAQVDQEAAFSQYEREAEQYEAIVAQLSEMLARELPVVVVPRDQIANFMFPRAKFVVVVGQDGLVANTAKYACELPIIGVNPAPERFDGVLLPYTPQTAKQAVQKALAGTLKTRLVTLAEVRLNDSQRMLAFNDLFIGKSGHSSARYTLCAAQQTEAQSSSGLLVATGAGSSGWLSSVFNMTQSIAAAQGADFTRPAPLSWETKSLRWVVREPFVSKHSSAQLVYGTLAAGEELVIESLMPEQGVIFSDGVEQDFLEFNSGAIARVRAAQQRAVLAVPTPVT